jgi:hypothetical protein
MATVTVNGQSYSGKNITVNGNTVVVDGVTASVTTRVLKIEIVGDIESLSCESCDSLHIKGNVKQLSTMSGDVDIEGDVISVTTASGDVTCKNINGPVKTISGDITCRNMTGDMHL